jgi:hypothetical protein
VKVRCEYKRKQCNLLFLLLCNQHQDWNYLYKLHVRCQFLIAFALPTTQKFQQDIVMFSCSGGVWINSFQNFLTVLNEKWWNMQYRQLCIRLKYEKYFTLSMTLIISLHVSGRYYYRFYTLTLFHIIIKTFLIYSTNTLKKYF